VFFPIGNAFLAALNSRREAILLSSPGGKDVVCQRLTRELQKGGWQAMRTAEPVHVHVAGQESTQTSW